MDKIINILLLVIIFVFDPLAISLVIAANFAFSQIKKPEPLPEPEPEPLPELILEEEPIQEEQEEEQEVVIPQEEIEYNPLDLNQDGIVDDDEISIIKTRIAELEEVLQTQSLSGWRQKKLQSEIDSLKFQIRREEEETKTY